MREWLFVFTLAETDRLSLTSLVHFWQQNNFQILYQMLAGGLKKGLWNAWEAPESRGVPAHDSMGMHYLQQCCVIEYYLPYEGGMRCNSNGSKTL